MILAKEVSEMRVDRLKERRKAMGWTQRDLAREMAASQSTIAMWETGANEPPTPTLERLAELLETSPAYLLGWTDDPGDPEDEDFSDIDPEAARELGNDPKRMRAFREALERDRMGESYPPNVQPISKLHHQRVPLIGSAAAGEPIYDPEDLGVYVDSPVEADAAITVRGASMEPTYLDGDVVYVKCRPDVDEGMVAVVFLDDEATIKHVYKRPTGLTLIGDNRAYPPILAEFEDYPNLRIFGVPVGYTRIYKR